MVVSRAGKPPGESGPLLDTSKSEKSGDLPAARGMQTGEVPEDRQDTRYLEISELDGNAVEPSEEP
jgi:hypothetical protein